MPQSFFSTLTAPQLPLLDQNFIELYALRNLFGINGSSICLGASLGAWSGIALQIGTTSAFYEPAAGFSNVASNLREQGSAGYYLANGTATLYSTNRGLGRHSWYTAPSGTAGDEVTLTEQLRLDISGNLTPGARDNVQTNGSPSNRWSVFHAGTSAISTSDANEKTAVRSLTEAEIAAAKALAAEPGAFKFLDAIAAKGEAAARWHIGMTVQRAIEIMTAHGLDPFAYGFICFDEWPADPESGTPAGSRYGFRNDELKFFIDVGREARFAELEARIAALEAAA